ncbi:hypothetical protein GCM10023075_67700 [Streptosporangium album]
MLAEDQQIILAQTNRVSFDFICQITEEAPVQVTDRIDPETVGISLLQPPAGDVDEKSLSFRPLGGKPPKIRRKITESSLLGTAPVLDHAPTGEMLGPRQLGRIEAIPSRDDPAPAFLLPLVPVGVFEDRASVIDHQIQNYPHSALMRPSNQIHQIG